MSYTAYCKKVHKVNLLFTYCLIALIVIPLVFLRGFDGAKLYIISGIAVAALATLNYFIPVPDRVKGFLFALLPLTVIFVLFFSIDSH